MGNYVVGTIHPFVLGQEILVYIDSQCIQVVECTLENMNEKVYQLCEKYNINKVCFVGGQLYALKFKDELVANKFGNKHIEVTIR